MIGTSLSYRNLLNTEDPLLSADVILPKLWERGVRSIELRAVPIGGAPEDALRVANILWDYGFQTRNGYPRRNAVLRIIWSWTR